MNEQVKSYSDQQLREMLTGFGMDVGPITSTTRTLYERKLVQYLTGSETQPSDVTDDSGLRDSPPKSPRRTPVAVNRASSESDLLRESPNDRWREPVSLSPDPGIGESTINLIRARKPVKRPTHEEPVSKTTSSARQTSPFPAANAQFRKAESGGSFLDHIIKFVLFGVVMIVVVYFITNQDAGSAIDHRK